MWNRIINDLCKDVINEWCYKEEGYGIMIECKLERLLNYWVYEFFLEELVI